LLVCSCCHLRALFVIGVEVMTTPGRVSFPFYAQRAVVTYYLMTRRLLHLYEAGNFSMLADLQRAI
jgi:hypothetical protein